MDNPYTFTPRDKSEPDAPAEETAQSGLEHVDENRRDEHAQGPVLPQPESNKVGGSSPMKSREKPKLSDEENRLVQRHFMHFVLLMFATLVTSSFALPYRLVALVFTAWGIVVGIRALQYAWSKQVRGASIGVLSIGIALTAILGMAVIQMIPRWEIEMNFQECQAQAITVQAKNTCLVEYKDALKNFNNTLR
ncbi:hypothetical protein [Timonella sp. A28]|uniref:hypothetical protein n=1 Tax=Timonella sp. A28 TaxID=3442640 RepID=UPI003EBD0553